MFYILWRIQFGSIGNSNDTKLTIITVYSKAIIRAIGAGECRFNLKRIENSKLSGCSIEKYWSHKNNNNNKSYNKGA